MITTQALGALRVAATLTHSLPGLRTRIRAGDRLVLEVREPRDGIDADPESAPVMSPCAFRCAVARAHRNDEAGTPMAMAGIGAEVTPTVEIGTPPGGEARAGGIYRVPAGPRHMWGVAVTLAADVAFAAGQDLVAAVEPLPEVVALGLRRDRATDVTFAFARTDAAPGSRSEATLVELLESLLARWTIHELLTATGTPARRIR